MHDEFIISKWENEINSSHIFWKHLKKIHQWYHCVVCWGMAETEIICNIMWWLLQEEKKTLLKCDEA